MAADNITYLQEINDQVIFTGGYMEVYIPRYYFEDKVAIRIGNLIETLGMFVFRVFKSEDDKTDNVPTHIFNFPSIMATKPTDSYNAKLPGLIKGSSIEEFTVLKYYKGDVFINNVNMVQKSDNTVLFINLLNKGKIPSIIPYNKVLETEIANLEFNNVNLKVPATVMELIISEIYRDKNDLTKSFRFRAGQGANMMDYRPTNIKSISTFNSTFTGITFENIDYNITASVNKARQGKSEAISPIEKTIKY